MLFSDVDKPQEQPQEQMQEMGQQDLTQAQVPIESISDDAVDDERAAIQPQDQVP
jgi:hypothetical protein